MNDIIHGAGFLGLGGNFLADVGLVLSLGVILLFTVGMVLAWREQYETHKWVQTAGVVLNPVLVAWLMIGPYIGEVAREFGNPPYPAGFYWLPTVHGLTGAAALVFGVYVTLRGHNVQLPKALMFNNYKPYMRVAYGLYLTATMLCIAVYVMWFMISPVAPNFEN